MMVADIGCMLANMTDSGPRSMLHQQFKEEDDKYLTDESEPSELIYFF